MEHMSNIFSTSFGINFAKLTRVWLALISLTAKINNLLFLSHPVYNVYYTERCTLLWKFEKDDLNTYFRLRLFVPVAQRRSSKALDLRSTGRGFNFHRDKAG